MAFCQWETVVPVTKEFISALCCSSKTAHSSQHQATCVNKLYESTENNDLNKMNLYKIMCIFHGIYYI